VTIFDSFTKEKPPTNADIWTESAFMKIVAERVQWFAEPVTTDTGEIARGKDALRYELKVLVQKDADGTQVTLQELRNLTILKHLLTEAEQPARCVLLDKAIANAIAGGAASLALVPCAPGAMAAITSSSSAAKTTSILSEVAASLGDDAVKRRKTGKGDSPDAKSFTDLLLDPWDFTELLLKSLSTET
jgi:hypothetical protein